MACPKCDYSNDETFHFCQQCGYRRRTFGDGHVSPQKKLLLDEDGIIRRVQELVRQRSSSRYARQKSALEREFALFLASLTTPKSLVSVLPGDVIAFLVWKDKGEKTKVHGPTCPALNIPGLTCACPTRLAFGTVDSLIGKLRAILAENSRGSEWHSHLGVGNPAA